MFSVFLFLCPTAHIRLLESVPWLTRAVFAVLSFSLLFILDSFSYCVFLFLQTFSFAITFIPLWCIFHLKLCDFYPGQVDLGLFFFFLNLPCLYLFSVFSRFLNIWNVVTTFLMFLSTNFIIYIILGWFDWLFFSSLWITFSFFFTCLVTFGGC